MKSVVVNELEIYKQVAEYMNLRHPGVSYHFDLQGVNNPSRFTRILYGKVNAKGWPDLFIAQPVGEWHGLFLELKREGTRVYKLDGSLVSDLHIIDQWAVLQRLRQAGYKAEFAVGFEQAVELIEGYLNERV